MSIVFSKKKEKRSRSSSRETNNSFVKNVTSRVSGLLPATITKWFGSPSTSSANGSAPTADVTDSSTDDEATESPIPIQPPSKRMRFNSPGKYNHYGVTDSNCTPIDIDVPDTCNTYAQVQSPPGRNTFRRESNFASTFNASTEDNTPDRSVKDNTMFKMQHSVSNVGASVAPKRKSLFSSPCEASVTACASTSHNTIIDPKEPRFKPGLLGSPFYPGRTNYGGASASYINHPNIKQRKIRLVNEANPTNNTISHSARRILDLLEDYSSPLDEAKRIAPYLRTSRSESINTSITSSPYFKPVQSYKTQELHVPRIASILRLKQRNRLMDTTTAARQIIASHSSTSDYVPPDKIQRNETVKEPSNKLTTKVKSRLTRPRRGDNYDFDTEPTPTVVLPDAVLQIDQDKLPKFSFDAPPATSSLLTPASSSKYTFTETKTRVTETTTTTKTVESTSETDGNSDNPYKFSSPVRISNDCSNTTTTPPKYTFDSPQHGTPSDKQTKCEGSSTNKLTVTQPVKTNAQDQWKCPTCWVSNNSDVSKCICCETEKPSNKTDKPSNNSKPAKCTVCKLADSVLLKDKCVNCDKIKVNNIATSNDTKWKCSDCWVNNDESADTCVCCGMQNPNKKQKTVPKVSENAESEWKCLDCWIKNRSSLDKCAACGGAKPGTKKDPKSDAKSDTKCAPAAISLYKPMTNPIKISKPEAEKWECPTCLVRNDDDRSMCICCESSRPGSNKVPQGVSFKFGHNTSFKFGINTTQEPAKMEDKNRVDELETNNNVLGKIPSFTFGLPAKKTDDKPESTKKVEEKASEVPKINFTFGIPKSAVATAPSFTSPIKSPVPITKVITEEEEKPQEVPKVDFAAPKKPFSVKVATNLFTPPPLTSQIVPEKPTTTLASSTILDTPLVPEKPILTTSDEASKPTFSFTSSTIQPNKYLFGASPTIQSAGLSFAPPSQSTPVKSISLVLNQKNEPTNTPSVPAFQKAFPDNTTVSLFQKPEQASDKPAPPSLGATAPIFSFGTMAQQQTALPVPEKPKFNFSFGSTKPEASMFKTTFATSAEANPNKFTLSSNTLGGNGLSGTTLGGNGLSAPNPLASGLVPNDTTNSGGRLQSNSLPAPSAPMFGAPVQKENIWSANSTTAPNPFVANTTNTINTPQKPAFTFGSSTPFSATNATPTFGNTAQSPPNMFGMGGQSTTNQTSLFPSPAQNQSAPSIFGAPQAPSNPAPSLGLFGTPGVGAAPTFGAPNPSLPPFEAPHAAAPPPAFNFGAPQANGVFGFGQQQAPQQAGGMYNFAAAPAPGGQVQFNMGSSPAQRRVRKAVRRTTPR